MIIDFHTHVFPDRIAASTVSALEAASGNRPYSDGTADGLLAALDAAGVDFFISETNISLQEARAAVLGIREVSDKPIFVTMTVDESGFTLGGDSLASNIRLVFNNAKVAAQTAVAYCKN